MAKVITISINTIDTSDKKQTMNVSYINPEVANNKLVEFAQMLTALTTDSYVGVMKITKESVI